MNESFCEPWVLRLGTIYVASGEPLGQLFNASLGDVEDAVERALAKNGIAPQRQGPPDFLERFDGLKNDPEARRRFLDGESYLSQAMESQGGAR